MGETAEYVCQVCREKKTCVVHPMQPTFRPTICDECETRLQREAKRKETLGRVMRVIPYPTWDHRLGNADTMRLVRCAAEGMTSLYIFGDTGAGKTRALCQASTRAMFGGHSLAWRNCAAWCDQLAALAGHSMLELDLEKKAAAGADILVLDDLGKGKATERVASTIFDIVDRCIRSGTLLWITTNKTPEALERQFGDEYGAPLVRRIVEVCAVVAV